MNDLFTLQNLMTLGMLVLLQIVLGFDNLLYISLESKRAPAEKQSMVRKTGIGLAVIFRILLLIVLMKLVSTFEHPIFTLHREGFVDIEMNFHALINLVGGAFILYTATKEILHMMSLELEGHHERKAQSAGKIIALIVVMNLVFSFDSILSAMALSDNAIVMGTAIVMGGLLMIWLADRVSNFLQRNRMYEVLGLFVLFVVGIMLLTEGAHLAHTRLLKHEIMAMTKPTFYFVIAVLLLTDVVQSRYQKKLNLAKQEHAEERASLQA